MGPHAQSIWQENLQEVTSDMKRKRKNQTCTAPGTTIVGFSASIQLYDATYSTLSMGNISGAARRAGADIVLMILDVSRPSLMSGPGGESGAGLGVKRFLLPSETWL